MKALAQQVRQQLEEVLTQQEWEQLLWQLEKVLAQQE